jgi:hypothetical protein
LFFQKRESRKLSRKNLDLKKFLTPQDIPGNRPIENCLSEMKLYDECMERAIKERRERTNPI